MKKLIVLFPLLLVACNRTERPYDANIIPSDVVFVSKQDISNSSYANSVIVNDRSTVTLMIDIPAKINTSNLSGKFSLKFSTDTIPLNVTHKEYLALTDNHIHTLITIKTTQPLNFEKGEYDTDFHLEPIYTADGKKHTLKSKYELTLHKAQEVLQGSNLKLVAGEEPVLTATITNPTNTAMAAFVVRGSCHEDFRISTFYQAIPEVPAKASVQVELQFRNGDKTLRSGAECNIWGARGQEAIAIE